MFRWIHLFSNRRAECPSSGQNGPKPRASLSQAEWHKLRAPLRHRDLSLSDKARRWADRLPEDARPRELCERFPRIANRLAACWTDTGMTDYLFDDLLVDRRGNRQGFPPEVARELARLRDFHEQRVSAEHEALEAEAPPTDPSAARRRAG